MKFATIIRGGLLLAFAGSSAALASPATVAYSLNPEPSSFQVGKVLVTPTPPSTNFDALTASNATLRANGFPERPAGTPRGWFVGALSHTKWVHPRFTPRYNHQPASPSHQSASSTSELYSSHWAGNQGYNGGQFNSIVAKWNGYEEPSSVTTLVVCAGAIAADQ
jgi:hypothetical protein